MNPIQVTATIFSTDKFTLSRAEDDFHDGWPAFTAEPASVEWIGENLRRSLIPARYVRLSPERWGQALYDEHRKSSDHEMGAAVPRMLAVGTISGKRVPRDVAPLRREEVAGQSVRTSPLTAAARHTDRHPQSG